MSVLICNICNYNKFELLRSKIRDAYIFYLLPIENRQDIWSNK